MKYLSWIITLPLTVIAVIFAISNLHSIAVGFWPLEQTFSLPLYIAVLATFVVGFICGGVVLWFSAGKTRRKARRLEFEAVGYKREIASLKQKGSQQAAQEAHRPGAASADGQRQITVGNQSRPTSPGQAASGGPELGQSSTAATPARLTGT